MHKGRLEAFSDGVIAVVITVMVLELKVPAGVDISALHQVLHPFLNYVLSFVFVALYWNNHHHMLQAAQHVNGKILWANSHLLFWISLVPFATAWVSEHGFASLPVALYGVVLFFAAIAYYILAHTLVAHHGHGSKLSLAIGRDFKGKVSLLAYAIAIGLAFVEPWLSYLCYIAVAILWLVPDKRIEKVLEG